MLQTELIQAALDSGNSKSALGPALTALRPGLPEAAEAASELGKIFLEAWNEFHIGAVVELVGLLKDQGIDDETLNEVRKPLKDAFKSAQKWAKPMATMRSERFARELRSAIRRKDYAQAVDLSVEILKDQPEGQRGLEYLGSLYGSVENDQPAAQQVMKQLLRAKSDIGPAGQAAIEEGMKKRLKSIMGGASEYREREFLTGLTQATVDLKAQLPGSRDKDRAKEMIANFSGDIKGIIAVAFRFPEKDYWPDITRLLVEFLPKTLAGAGKAAGVEERLYTTLSSSGKRGCRTMLRELGQRDVIVMRFEKMALEALDAKDNANAVIMVELLGGMRNEKACSLIIDVMETTKNARLEAAAVTALGNIASPRAIKSLLAELRQESKRKKMGLGSVNKDMLGELHKQIKGAAISGEQKAAVRNVLTALGNITRNPKTPEEQRERLFDEVRAILPDGERDLLAMACQELIALKTLDKLAPKTRQWVAAILTEDLWTPFQVVEGQTGPEGRPSALGERQKSADLLTELAKTEMPTILEIAQPKAMRFSGAQMALGEVFAKAKNPTTLPLLEMMIRSAGTHRATGSNAYDGEAVFDVESEKYVQLSPPKVLESLIFAVKEIAESEIQANQRGPGVKMALEIYEASRDGDLPQVEGAASELLYDLNDKLVKAGVAGASPTTAHAPGAAAHRGAGAFKPKAPAVDPDQIADDDIFEKPAGDDMGGLVEVSEEEYSAATQALNPQEKLAFIKALKKGGIFAGKRRKNKIEAMMRLASACAVESVPLIVDHVSDKDTMVSAAAGTALIEFSKVKQPASVRAQVIEEMFRALLTGRADTQRNVRGVLKQMHLTHPANREIMKKQIAIENSPGMIYELSMILEKDQSEVLPAFGIKPAKATSGQSEEGEDSAEEGKPGAFTLPKQSIVGGSLDAKRAYFEARRAWIAGGKKGAPPPEPPQ